MKIHHAITPRGDRPPLALAIGFFDGVHLGHRAIFEQLRALRSDGVALSVLTFFNHPAEYLRPSEVPKLITTTEERVNLLAACGIEELYLLRFEAGLAHMRAHDFLESYLVDELNVKALVVGEGFHFGHNREGDVQFAHEHLTPRGIVVEGAKNVHDQGERVSSSRIRTAILAGEIATADALLGAPYAVEGTVVLGTGRGHDLGFPTANLRVDARKALPCDGVYSVYARVDGRDYPALLSLGSNPTFSGAVRTVEVWIDDFSTTIYGESVRLHELRLIRAQERFADVDALIAQMHRDKSALHQRFLERAS